jgi:pimeloyl-ACP methyl ester carboxylesterase
MYALRGNRRIFFEELTSAAHPQDGASRDRPVVLLVHGGPGFAHDYLLPWLSPLVQVARLLVLDLPGAGRSSRHPGSQYPLSDYVADIGAVRAAGGARRVILLAHAWGAIAAVEYALAEPGSVVGIIAVNPLRILRAEGQDTEAQARMIALTDPGIGETYSQELWPLIQRAVGGDESAWPAIDSHPWWARMWRTQFSTPPRSEWNTAVAAMHWGLEAYFAHKGAALSAPDHPLAQFDLGDRVSLMESSMLIIASDADANYVAPARIHACPLYESARCAELAIMPGLGHFPFAEQPQEFARLVAQFIGDTRECTGEPIT